jgi:hypothetical protein
MRAIAAPQRCLDGELVDSLAEFAASAALHVDA